MTAQSESRPTPQELRQLRQLQRLAAARRGPDAAAIALYDAVLLPPPAANDNARRFSLG